MPAIEGPGILNPQQLDALVGNVQDGLIVTDVDGNVIYMNAAARETYGLAVLGEAEQDKPNLRYFVESTFETVTMAGEPVPKHEDPLYRALAGTSQRCTELRIRHRESGEERVFEFSSARLEADTPVNVLTIRDVTDEFRAERRYRISFEINPAPTVIAHLDDLMLVDVNEGFTELTGITKDVALGKSLDELGLLGKEGELNLVLDELRAGRIVDQRQTKIGTGDRLRDVLVAARGIEIDNRESGIFTFIDITELELAQRRLRETTTELDMLYKELGTFSYSAAHDLRTPLRGIDGFTQALLEEYGDRLDDRGHHYLSRVRAATAHLGKLIDSLVLLASIGRLQLRPVVVDLSQLAETIIADLQDGELRPSTGMRIEPNMITVGDRALLRILLTELLKNAWHFTRWKHEAVIEVGVERREEESVFFVKDNGTGFDPEFSGKLFQPFQTLHSSKERPGPGIGLTLAERIVTRHGGKIWAEGEPESGAAFRFTMPSELGD